jgi:hypothetical protein
VAGSERVDAVGRMKLSVGTLEAAKFVRVDSSGASSPTKAGANGRGE